MESLGSVYQGGSRPTRGAFRAVSCYYLTFLPITHNTVASTQIMSDDEIVAGPPGATSVDARGASESKPKYRSWRKKYRKMKTHFDDVMKESNSLFVDEQKLDALSKRLQEQNE